MTVLRISRLLVSAMILLSVAVIITHLMEARVSFSAFNFFSYFTNQSNLLVALFFLTEAFLRWRKQPLSRSIYDRTRGALLLYMSMTSSIYWLFLHHLVNFPSAAASLANIFLHSGGLAMLLLDLLIDRPATRICKRFFVIWLIYPIIYGAVIMLLGSMRAWYPYPFLNINHLGLSKWSVWNGSMALGIGVFAVTIILLNNGLRRETIQNSVKR